MQNLKPMTFPTLAEFYDILQKHDWFYMMSDDPYVSRKGEYAQRNIRFIANHAGREYMDLFNAYDRHVFSGDAWETPKQPKPARPAQ